MGLRSWILGPYAKDIEELSREAKELKAETKALQLRIEAIKLKSEADLSAKGKNLMGL